ncbi:MAG: hypothetical protein HPY57_14905 [Ignavibacteria bacterium]|nr:hypothetical protein [Ignavibacteria bacterium]
MAESKKYSESELLTFNLEELESLKLQEMAYLDNGTTLLEAILNTPFKNKEKFEKLKSKISIHSTNISNIDKRIDELKNSKKENFPYGSLFTIGGPITWTTTYVNQNYTKLKLTKIKYADCNNEVKEGEVLDDIFQSTLGNFYMTAENGSMVPLERIIEIDQESRSGKWYITMCKNLERNKKLKRVLNGKDINNESDC